MAETAFTLNGHDWSSLYSPIVAAACRVAPNAAIDGEIIVQDDQGRSDFGALREAIKAEPRRLVFVAFDVLYLDGEDLRESRLVERRARLRDLIGDHDPGTPIQFSPTFEGTGKQLLDAACGIELEGIVSKRASSRYRSGRQKSWLKVKCYDEGDYLVVGAEHEPGKPAFALLARESSDGLEYAGSAFVTLGGDERDRFWTAVDRHGRAKPALQMDKRKGARWVDPVLRVRAQHLKGSGKLRHATIRELLP
ncbi:hypothetical protein KRR38_32210 [Novosphingobium sp. G106]|uniref:ATP-dependent DNA ligase n=1 Tax=Novosphingobium sp. G106 TaxID=2849500 RepID=UPI001C2D1D21|nr:hypothetical protein [Novosphingobium sp. G106]MBV1692203.1 hypothetical protein [Novosphingobium sp. G106]